MNRNCYIIGKSLICSLGNTQKQITNNIRNLNQGNYEKSLENKFKEKSFYSINGFSSKASDRFFSILKVVIDDAIKNASLNKKEKEDLHIFIGSTSMGISIDEEQSTSLEIERKNAGYGYIGTFVEEYIQSKHKSLLFSTACTSSINAFCYASKLICHKKIKNAIVIGIELYNHSTYNGFSSFQLLSKNNIYRPFDYRSDGIILGEGCSAVILGDESNHKNNFKYVSSANICDNYSETTSDPSGKPIFDTIESSLNNANIKLENIDLIKGHATGSENNNSSEANAISSLFEKHETKIEVTALKPYIGHTLGASGINELVFLLYCVEDNFVPACLGFNNSIEGMLFEPIIEHKNVSNKLTLLLNFVAFGGNNTSLIISNKD